MVTLRQRRFRSMVLYHHSLDMLVVVVQVVVVLEDCNHNTLQLADRYIHQYLDMFENNRNHSNHNDMFHHKYNQQMNSYLAMVVEHNCMVEVVVVELGPVVVVEEEEEVRLE